MYPFHMFSLSLTCTLMLASRIHKPYPYLCHVINLCPPLDTLTAEMN